MAAFSGLISELNTEERISEFGDISIKHSKLKTKPKNWKKRIRKSQNRISKNCNTHNGDTRKRRQRRDRRNT